MPTVSVAEVEARSGIDKEPGETVAEYLRRVGDRADMPAEDVEAVVTELQRQRFAGETVDAADADAPIEAFLEAADDLGDDAGDPESDAAEGRGEFDDLEADAEGADDEAADAAAGTAASGPTAATDDADEGDPMAFYRSVAVLGVVVLLAGGVIGSAVLLGTDLGSSGDGPEASGDADALDDAANGTDDEDGASNGTADDRNGSDDAAANGSGANETTTNETDDEDGASNDTADDRNTSADDADGNGTDGDDGTDDEPIGFDGEATNDTDAENGSDGGVGAGGDGDGNDSDGDENGSDTEGTDDEPVGFGEDANGTDDEIEDAGGEDGTDDPDAVDSAAEAGGSLEVTDRAAPGDHPADEYVELTNVGDTALDMSGWTVRDREGGAVDTHGIEPLEFPEGFVLEPGESVRLVTGDGEDTAETIHWGQDRQYWRSAGDVVVVRDEDGETVLRHPYGDQA